MAVSFTTVVGTTTYGFDWIDQEIEIDAATNSITAADLKVAIHDAMDEAGDGITFDPIASFGNPVTLTASSSTFLTVILLDQWRILTLELGGTFTVGEGNVVNVNNGIDIFAANGAVTTVNNTSAAGVLVQGLGSGLTAAQALALDRIDKHTGLDLKLTY